MGEWSKKIGEYGENLVEKILSVVGWTDLLGIPHYKIFGGTGI